MSTHHRGDRADFHEQQAARVALMEARVAMGLSPTTGEPIPESELDTMRQVERQKPAMIAAQRKRFRRQA